MCWAFLKKKRDVPKEAPTQQPPPPQQQLTDEEMRALFKKHDSNGDGHLDKKELTEAFKELGSHLPGWRASQAIQHNDFDLDGDIDDHEIGHLITYVRSLGL